MTDNRELILGNNLTFAYYPFAFKEAIEKHCSYAYSDKEKSSLGAMGKYWKFIEGVEYLKVSENQITITQNKGVDSATVTIIVDGIESIDVYSKKGTRNIVLEKSIFNAYMVGNIEIDFKEPITQIKLNFRFELAEPLIIKVNTIFYSEPKVVEPNINEEKMNVKHRVGESLVNIFFQPVNERIIATKVELYLDDNDGDQLIGTYYVKENMKFIAITELAYGKYKYKVVQTERQGKSISSETIPFSLNRPGKGSHAIVSSNRD